MNHSKPLLRQAFDKVERAVGGPLEQLVASKAYTDVVVTINQVQKAIGGTVAGAASGAVEKMLHMGQLPTLGDVRRLNRQLAELASELRALSARLHEMRPPPPPALPKPTRTRQPAKLPEARPVAALPKAKTNTKTTTKTKTAEHPATTGRKTRHGG